MYLFFCVSVVFVADSVHRAGWRGGLIQQIRIDRSLNICICLCICVFMFVYLYLCLCSCVSVVFVVDSVHRAGWRAGLIHQIGIV